ncbi:hypothetical protein GQ53DRAFT_832933 [Thozetella sp. PMI_491]|nr:hypothetical protein GQ53DRAFT_832933 [Thozetella sp. PMI_491]
MPLLTAQSLLACLYFSGTALASIEFTIATGPCDNGAGLFNKCDDSAAGGMCASAPDITKKWCCPPATALCGSWGETCTGSSNTAGTGQIFCQSDDGSQKWCCNAKYDICVADAGVFNLCRTKFENPYANTTEEDALRLKSAYLSSSVSDRSLASDMIQEDYIHATSRFQYDFNINREHHSEHDLEHDLEHD